MKSTMIQQEITGPKSIRFNEVPVPAVNPGQVLVKIKRVGVCGSDIHVYHGKHPYVVFPFTQGHEVSGQVVAIGAGVTGIAVGQKVTIEPQVYCGHCYPCTHGKYNLCESLKVMGFQTTGTASEYFAADASKVTPLPDEMSYDEGAMIEPLAVTVRACKRPGDVKGKKIVVLGAGPIGILMCQTLKAFGAAEVMVTDVSDYRLQLAKECGADYVFNTRNVDFGKVLVESFGPDKADIIYDCAGNDITMGQAIQNARKGSIIILVAVYAGTAHVDLAKLNDSELDLNTSMMYQHEDYVDAIRIVAEGKVVLKPLISKHFSLTEYQAAYEYIDNNRETTMKVLIDVDPAND
jgi:L-iditol 2-dehydrogenase